MIQPQFIIFCFFILTFVLNLSLGIGKNNPLYNHSFSQENSAWSFDFSQLQIPIRKDLKQNGFTLKKAMKWDKSIHLSIANSRLNLHTNEPNFGMIIKDDLVIEDADWIKIDWGIDLYPRGSNWEKGVNREAIMIYLFFGEPVEADKFYLPDSPYFLAFFLGEKENTMQTFVGNSYTRTGRYICLANPTPGERTSSTFNFRKAFMDAFNTTTVPPITGIGIEVDTKDLPDGQSRAFIYSINLTKKNMEEHND